MIHIYGQERWHDSVGIVGTRESVEALRDALSAALQVSHAEMQDFVNDGEGFEIAIKVVSEQVMHQMAVPYSSEEAKEPTDSKRIFPA
ncbi:hypothetical protein [Sinimarinibacterium sp. NLF-5-8]|uniref:hypothetical protein n=1 Tax=Sinimarinibacterium sp. NLF-5-8 TaxID=2698684 RepID=UPI00137C302D|nr:hypothetical protein [Sinimarinibacterium sp. NLF-5-8]QHS09056.1 hypothetical protein GT972_02110 [Sinimarinibacterium sp. NLF-5-8]